MEGVIKIELGIIVGALIFTSGVLFLLHGYARRNAVIAGVRQEFSTGSAQGRQKGRLFLTRFYPKYEKLIRQAQAEDMTPERLERQQWTYGIIMLCLGLVAHASFIFTALVVIGGYLFPVQQLKGKAKQIENDVRRELRLFLLGLQLYVTTGLSEEEALRELAGYLTGHLKAMVEDVNVMLQTDTFTEAMERLARISELDPLKLVAKSLKQGARHKASTAEAIQRALDLLDEEDKENGNKLRERTKYTVYMKLLTFFIVPLLIDVALYVWGMISGVIHML